MTAHFRVIQILQALSTASETSIKVFRRGVVDCRIRAGGQAWREKRDKCYHGPKQINGPCHCPLTRA
jgi:hypothetical protein